VENGNQGNSYFDLDSTKCVSSGIKVRRLDDYWKTVLNKEQVYLMKIDIQGFEGFAIQGGAEMFKTKPPLFVFMEFSPGRYRTYGVDGAKLLRDLIGYGYSIQTNMGRPVNDENGKIEELANIYLTNPTFEIDLELTHASVLRQKKQASIKVVEPKELTLFSPIVKPYKCESPGNVVQVELRQPFITADPQPVSWKMYLHPRHDDIYVSASVYENQGNNMFEMHLKERIYECLRGTVGGYPQPADPLFLDVGTNIGMSHFSFSSSC